MHCCFIFPQSKGMNYSRSSTLSSVNEHLERDQICQEICKTITNSVEGTGPNNLTSLPIEASTLLPELNSDDDIEGILHQISELLGSQIGDSQCNELEGTDSLSVDEILKEAENLVRSSTPYFEKVSNGLSEPILEPINSNLKLYKSQPSEKSHRSHNSVHEDTGKDATGADLCVNWGSTSEISELSDDKIRNNSPGVVAQSNTQPENLDHVSISPRADEFDKSVSPEEIPKENEMAAKVTTNAPQSDLLISDLQVVQPGSTFVLETEVPQKKNEDKVTTPPKVTSQNINDNTDSNKLETAADLKNQVLFLSAKVAEYSLTIEKLKKVETLSSAERQRIKFLQNEIKSQEELIEGYQSENQRLASDVISAKEAWKETEMKLVEKIVDLDGRLKSNIKQYDFEIDDLNNKLKKAYDLIRKLEVELERFKGERDSFEKKNQELTVNVTRLDCEVIEYKKELLQWGETEREKFAVMENNALLQAKLSQSNTEITKKQTEIIRLNGEIGRLRGELEKIRLGSVVNHTSDSSNTVTQLQAALAVERENSRDISKDRDNLSEEIFNLRKQVKDMEGTILQISKSDSCNNREELFSYVHTKGRDPLQQRLIDLELKLNGANHELTDTKQVLKDLQDKYDRDIFDISQRLKTAQRENGTLKHMLDEAKHRRAHSTVTSVKEDAHLLATIRGLKVELTAREREAMRLNKELDDAKKTNKRLQKEREKALNTGNKMRGSHYGKDTEKPGSRACSEVSSNPSSKDYNPSLFEDNQEATLYLKKENRGLKEEIKRLEQDLISLHNKRIQDLSDLQEQHEMEIARLVREHAAKHSSSTVAHLQNQLYTQQMVIHHLKEQIKEMEGRMAEFSMMKSERDHLETTLIEANKKIARLHDLASPESVQYSSLLEKLEFLERRHEVREQKLQSIVRDLIAKQGQSQSCSSNCRDKLLNKNREICYYRAEMDKILATLAEFRWN